MHIYTGNITIKSANEAKYLGVIFDHTLSFRQHIQYAAKMGTEFGLAISRIAKCTWGTAYQQTCTLFTSVAAPRMDYAAIVWYKPSKGRAPPPRISIASNPGNLPHHCNLCATNRDVPAANPPPPQEQSRLNANCARNPPYQCSHPTSNLQCRSIAAFRVGAAL